VGLRKLTTEIKNVKRVIVILLRIDFYKFLQVLIGWMHIFK